MIIIRCSGMFRNVSGCSGMFHVPGFIDGLNDCRFVRTNFISTKMKIHLQPVNVKGRYRLSSGAIIGDGDRKSWDPRVPMIWDNFSIFRTNFAIACGTRAYMLRGFLRMSRGGNGVRNSRYFLCFWPTTQRVYVCWNFA